MLLGIISMMSFRFDRRVFYRVNWAPWQLAALAIDVPRRHDHFHVHARSRVGAMASISRAPLGEGARDKESRRYATDSLSLSFVCVLFLTRWASFTITPSSGRCGATGHILLIWSNKYIGHIGIPGMLFFRGAHDRQ